MDCIHESCGSIDKVWLHFKINNESKRLKTHPFCVHCGAVKNISHEKLRNIAFYMNVMARIDKHITRITEFQWNVL